MTTLDRLLQAILDNPEDIDLRLIFADACDEAGDEDRASFIRIEMALAATGQTECQKKSPRVSNGTLIRPQMLSCGACDFCKLQIAAERHHETHDLWLGIAGDLPFGYAHTSRHWSQFTKPSATCLYTRHGFIDRVECTMRFWYGEQCGECRGYGAHAIDLVCGECHGTGKMGGFGPAIVRAHPVRFVAVADKKPANRGNVWYWFYAHKFPSASAHLGTGMLPSCFHIDNSTQHNTEADAMTALSIALITWAKSQPV